MLSCMVKYHIIQSSLLPRDLKGAMDGRRKSPVIHSSLHSALWMRSKSGIVAGSLRPKPHSVAMSKSLL